MFSDSDRAFISDNMKIVVESIESKLREPLISEFSEIAYESISKYIDAIKKHEISGATRDIYLCQDNAVEKFIKNHFCEITKTIESDEVKQVLDALRYSFSCYAYNGLHQLYTRQENECWHPEIKLTEVLEPNDIESLPKVLTLYRGCDISEFKNKSYGQAWTTSLEVAREFAYNHYRNQDWFDEKNRAVLEAKNYSKNYVLFSCQSIEYEVVIDVDRLIDVGICA